MASQNLNPYSEAIGHSAMMMAGLMQICRDLFGSELLACDAKARERKVGSDYLRVEESAPVSLALTVQPRFQITFWVWNDDLQPIRHHRTRINTLYLATKIKLVT